MSLPSRSFPCAPQNSPPPDWKVPLSAPSFTLEEIEAAVGVLESGWWTYGPVARLLEEEFANFTGTGHAVAVSSGTAALHLAFLALGLKSGDEVLVPSLNFVAAASAVLHSGGAPRFADVASAEAPLVSAETLERALTPRVRGACIMHYGGYACRMDEIRDLCSRRGLWLVEDAAHAPGGSWRGIPCGAWGDIGCFSFFGNKNLTCGEGGMLVTDNEHLAARLRMLRSHGMSSLTWDRYRGHQLGYEVVEAGFNYRLDDLRAALLRVQLRSLERLNARRRLRVAWYHELLEGMGPWRLTFSGQEAESACHLFALVLDEGICRESVMLRMRQRGVQTSIHYPPIHRFAFFRKVCPENADLKVTEDLGARILTLPLYPDLSRSQVEEACSALREASL